MEKPGGIIQKTKTGRFALFGKVGRGVVGNPPDKNHQ